MLHLLLGAVLISFSAVFVKLAHVFGDSAGFYRMFLGALGLLAVLSGRMVLGRSPELSPAGPFAAFRAVLPGRAHSPAIPPRSARRPVSRTNRSTFRYQRKSSHQNSCEVDSI